MFNTTIILPEISTQAGAKSWNGSRKFALLVSPSDKNANVVPARRQARQLPKLSARLFFTETAAAGDSCKVSAASRVMVSLVQVYNTANSDVIKIGQSNLVHDLDMVEAIVKAAYIAIAERH